MKNNTLSPLFLQSVIGPFSAIGSVGSTIPLEIYNPNKTAMLVDQVRFSFRDASIVNIPPSYYTAFAVEALLGSIPLTNQHIALGALAPRYLGLTAQDDNAFGPAGDSGLVWHFPKPLYVPPLVQLSFNVKRQKASPNDAVVQTLPAMVISVVGRSLPDDFPIPGSINIPWVTQTQCNEVVSRFVSADSDLVNSNKGELRVTQFVGISFNEEQVGPTPVDMTVQMSLSNGTMLVRDSIPFFLAFPSDRGILPVDARLQSGAFVRLELESNPPVDADNFAGVGFTAVAMHGYREIQTPGTFG